MGNYNKVQLLGHLGKNPEVKETANGNKLATFRMATNRKNKDGEKKETWFTVNAWGQKADFVSSYLSQGDQVFVEGSLHATEYPLKIGGELVTGDNGNPILMRGYDIYALDVQPTKKRGDGGISDIDGGEAF